MVKDYLNREICVGDTIHYPTRRSSWMSMQTARVIGVDQYKPLYSRDLDELPYRLHIIKNTKRWMYDHATRAGKWLPSTWQGYVYNINQVISFPVKKEISNVV